MQEALTSIANRTLPLLVKPASGQCNLRCAHCFYTPSHMAAPLQAGKMSIDTLKVLTKSYLALPLAEHAFIWQGGEPTLMGYGFYSTAVRLQQQYSTGGTIRNYLQTNGTLLTPEFAKFLARHDFLVGVSLDGGQHFHDTYRVFPSGKGSHAIIQKHLGLLRQHGANVNALTLVTSNSAGHMAELFQDLLTKGLLHHQYIPCVEWTAQGKLQPWSLRSGQWGDALCALFEIWWPHRFTVSVRYFDALLHALAYDVPSICHMAKSCDQYLVVEHNGQVFPCDFFVKAHWSLGNIRTNSWEEILHHPLRVAFAEHKTPPQSCMACAYLKLCSGDCPKHRGGSEGSAQSYLCADYQQFFEYALPKLTALAHMAQAHARR